MSNLLIILLALFSCSKKADIKGNPIIPDEDKGHSPVEVPFSKGVNLSDWFLVDSENDIYKEKYTRRDFANIKSLGIDVLRLPIRFYKIAGPAPNYTLSESFFQKLDYVLDLAEEFGLYIIIDNHSYFSANVFPSSYGEEQLTKIWRQVATYCKNRSDKVLLELYNEPDGDYMKQNWGEIQGRFIKSIREIDNQRKIVVGGYDANSPSSLKFLPNYEDENLIYTFHLYDPFLFTHQSSDWSLLKNVNGIPFPYTASSVMPQIPPDLIGTGKWGEELFINYPMEGTVATIKNSIDEAIAFRNSRNVPVFCGEFGAYINGTDNDQRCLWYKVVNDYFEENKISWTMWDYHNSFGLFNKGSLERFEYDLNIPLLNALKFNVPSFYNPEEIHEIVFYDDWISEGMQDGSWNYDKAINFAFENSPAEGQNSILWEVASEWTSLGLGIWPTISAKKQVDADYKLEFFIKCNKAVNIQVRFTEYQDHTQTWRIAYNITEDMVKKDGTWSKVSIPLKSFIEIGSIQDGVFTEPQGLFDWGFLNKLEFATEGNVQMIGSLIQIDEIKIAR